MSKEFRVESLSGKMAARYLEPIADMRMRVFRDYPYLYDGSLDYEKEYLSRYFKVDDAKIFLLLSDERIIGITTCMPLMYETATIKKPFEDANLNPAEYFYFGESLLERIYRGQGFGKLFFEYREKEALKHPDIKYTCFCAVNRPNDHPLKPSGYKPLNGFWEKMGYEKQPGLQTEMRWKDIDKDEETTKTLQYWIKKIR